MPFTLDLLPERLAICRFDAGAAVPSWAVQSSFFSITRTSHELSIVCAEAAVPQEIAGAERGWRSLRVQGPLDLTLTGVLAALAAPLADAKIPLFALSTFDTDYLLVREETLQPAITALVRADHTVREPAAPMLVKLGWRLPNNTRFSAHFEARMHKYEAEQDRWIVQFEKLVWMTEGMPAAVVDRVRALVGKWARVPNEARFGMTLPLKFETLAGKIRFFYDNDPAASPHA
jgi:hypothetical protein